MSDTVSSPGEHRGDDKLFGKRKWRGKFFPSDGRSGKAAENFGNTDNDIANFLHTADSGLETRPRSAPFAPRIDVSTSPRRSSAANVDQIDGIVDVYRRPKPRQNKGLCVRFEAAPTVIGIGGDEAELPSRDVSKSFAEFMRSEKLSSQERSHYHASDHQPKGYGRSTDPYAATSFQPPSPPRRPIGADGEFLADESHHAGHEREAVQSTFVGMQISSSRHGNEYQDLDLDLQKKDLRNVSNRPKDMPLSLRSVVKSLGDESLEDFDSRVRRFNEVFHLNASAHGGIMAVSFERWVRASAWWFLRGRGDLEGVVRAKSSAMHPENAANDRDLSSILKQAYVNLAKAWWILKEITPNLPAIRSFGKGSMSSMVAVIRSFGNKSLAELVEVHLTLLSNMRAVTMSMKRNGRLPDDLQMQSGTESQIFLYTPAIPPDIAALLVNNSTTKGKNHVVDPFFPIIVGDTPRHFSFCRMFVDAILDNCDDSEVAICIPCVVSVIRERTDWAVKAVVASQDGQIDLVIQSSEHGGLNWHGVRWNIPLHMMELGIAEGICLQIKFSEKDFKTIWGICDYTQQIRKEYSSSSGEEVVYERELPVVQCFDRPPFPAEPVKDCRVRLFEKKSITTENSGQHRAHDGYRLMVVTPPGTKALSKVNYQLGKDSPILFGTNRSKGDNTLLVKAPRSLRISFTFYQASDVELFRSTLSGTLISEYDHCSAPLQLQNFTINPVSTDQSMAYMDASRLRWHQLRVVSRGPSSHGHGSQLQARSNCFRILADCDSGTFTDRINAGPGELQLSSSAEDMNEIKLLRAAQQDATWSFVDGALEEADLSSLSNIIRSVCTSPSIRTYHFRSSSELHSFQAMLTGFYVLYDGLASTFSISRRRSVVPLHKH